MSDSKGINLRELIREVAADMPGDATPRDIAEKVDGQLTVQDRKALFLDILTPAVADVLRESRRHAFAGRNAAPPGPVTSAKLVQRRSWWSAMCGSRVHVGGGAWKQVGACTVEDLQFCIEERQTQIVQLQGQIVNFTALLDALERRGVGTVAELDETDVAA